MSGGTGNSVYLFGRGDGFQDRIWNYADTIYAIPLADPSPSKHNTLLFKAGVAPSDVIVRQVTDQPAAP